MDVGKTGQARHALIEPRVVLHGARAERKDAKVDGVVLLAEANIVAHHFRLSQAGKARRRRARDAAQTILGIGGALFRLWQVNAGLFGRADLKYQSLGLEKSL